MPESNGLLGPRTEDLADPDKLFTYKRWGSGAAGFLDHMIMFVGSRNMALTALGVFSWWSNGEQLRYMTGYFICRAFVEAHDAVSAIQYEKEDMQKWAGFAMAFLFMIFNVFSAMTLTK